MGMLTSGINPVGRRVMYGRLLPHAVVVGAVERMRSGRGRNVMLRKYKGVRGYERLGVEEGRRKLGVVGGKGGGWYARGVDSVPAMLSPGEAVLTPGAAEEVGREKIRALNERNPPSVLGRVRRKNGVVGGGLPGVRGMASGESYVDPEWSPAQQAIIDRINSGQTDYTFGPGAPGATAEDLGT